MSDVDEFDVDYALDVTRESTDAELKTDWEALARIEFFFDEHDASQFPVALREIMERKNAEYVRDWKPIVLAEMKRRGFETE